MTNYLHTIIRPGIDAYWEKEEPIFEPAPCDKCDSYYYCEENHTACPDFAYYVRTGKLENGNRSPTTVIYNRLFKRRNHGGS